MHACELVELAATVATQGPAFIESNSRPPSAAIEQYWSASRCRFDRWSQAIRRYLEEYPAADTAWRTARWPQLRAVCEEILTGEILTRVFATVMSAYDRRHNSDRVAPLARSTFIGHLEARHRVLTMLLNGHGFNVQQVMWLNSLRRRSERWSDMLIGYLALYVDITEFSVEAGRARDFAEDLCHHKAAADGSSAWSLVQASTKTSFGRSLGRLSANGDLNEKIAHGAMACFASDRFDSIGILQSLWMARLQGVADDAQGLLDELAADDEYYAGEEARQTCEAQLERLRKFGCC